MLKSAHHLGSAMFEENSDMRFADFNDIIEISAAKELLADSSDQQDQLAGNSNPLLKLLSFGGEAEAKSAE